MRICRIEDIDRGLTADKPSAVALGFFDGVHLGHARVIGRAKRYGIETMVLTFPRHPSAILTGRETKLIMSRELREKALESLGVDTVVYLDFASAKDYSPDYFVEEILIKKLNAQAVFCGFNYRFGKGAAGGAQELKTLCARHGRQAFVLPPLCVGGGPVSSTRIREMLESGRIEAAEELLGRPFELFLEVVHGRMLGRELGYPTINQQIPGWQIAPRFGVYSTYTIIGRRMWTSVTNVGIKPTVGSDSVLAETYIHGYRGDLYGKKIHVLFRKFLRSEKKFSGIEELREQMRKDAEQSLQAEPRGMPQPR